MSTGSGLWHFLYRLVQKFIRSVKSSEQEVATTWPKTKPADVIMMHSGNGDMKN